MGEGVGSPGGHSRSGPGQNGGSTTGTLGGGQVYERTTTEGEGSSEDQRETGASLIVVAELSSPCSCCTRNPIMKLTLKEV